MHLAILATHPVQYHVPIWRSLAKQPGLAVDVFYFNDSSVRGGTDPGFGVDVAWDVPLLEGYNYHFLTRDADLSRPSSVGNAETKLFLDKGPYDWVLIQGYTHGFERQVVRASKRKPYRVLMRGEFADHNPDRSLVRSVFRKLYLSRFYRNIDAFCYIGEVARQHLRAYGIPDSRMFHSPYTVDFHYFESQFQSLSREDCRKQLGIAEDTFAVLFSGKLIPRKNPLLLLQALAKLPHRDKVAFIVLGDGPLKAEVVQTGQNLLKERFHFHGFVNQSQLGRFFHAADTLVLPSNYETWGLVTNEAMQFGLPVVVTNQVGCHRDLVEDGVTGYVFPDGSVNALATVLERLQADSLHRRTLGNNARKRICTSFMTECAVKGIVRALGLEHNR